MANLQRLRDCFKRLYRWLIGDVQIIKEYTENDLEHVVHMGYAFDSKIQSRIFYHARQCKYTCIYGRWWIMSTRVYEYELTWALLMGNVVSNEGSIQYPHLCINLLNKSKRGHILAIDCHVREVIRQHK